MRKKRKRRVAKKRPRQPTLGTWLVIALARLLAPAVPAPPAAAQHPKSHAEVIE